MPNVNMGQLCSCHRLLPCLEGAAWKNREACGKHEVPFGWS